MVQIQIKPCFRNDARCQHSDFLWPPDSSQYSHSGNNRTFGIRSSGEMRAGEKCTAAADSDDTIRCFGLSLLKSLLKLNLLFRFVLRCSGCSPRDCWNRLSDGPVLCCWARRFLQPVQVNEMKLTTRSIKFIPKRD